MVANSPAMEADSIDEYVDILRKLGCHDRGPIKVECKLDKGSRFAFTTWLKEADKTTSSKSGSLISVQSELNSLVANSSHNHDNQYIITEDKLNFGYRKEA
jgi:hypothetical protein